MDIISFIRKELYGWGKLEKIFFPTVIISIIIISILTHDSIIALCSAIFGIPYTIFAGKGKISCYFFGICASICYSIISYKNSLFGNMLLNLGYYIPMQTLGIFRWRKHLSAQTQIIEKTQLTINQRIIYSIIATLCCIIAISILYYLNDKSPICDGITTVLSVFGLILTVKRCLEQWYIWFIVNGLSVIMWVKAYMYSQNCLATVLMWFVYWVLAIYFLITWKKELKNN